jgi:hypothetical protein
MTRPFHTHPWIFLDKEPKIGDVWKAEIGTLVVLNIEKREKLEGRLDFLNVQVLWHTGTINWYSWDVACIYLSGPKGLLANRYELVQSDNS